MEVHDPSKRHLLEEIRVLRTRCAKLERVGWQSDGVNKAEETLCASRDRFESLVQTVPTVILCLSPDFRILEFNAEAERIYGCKRAEALGKNYVDTFLPAEVRQAVAEDIKKVLAGEPTRGYENHVKCADGSERLLEWNVNRVLDDKGQPMGVIAGGRDITERKKLQERLSAIIYKSPIATAVGGADGSIIAFNEALETVIGYKSSEVSDVADWASKLYPDKEYREWVWKNIQQALDGEEQDCTEFTITCKDGSTKVVDFHTSFFKGGLIVQMLDITERKQTDNLAGIQRDLAAELSAATELEEGLRLCVDAAIAVSGMDCGGVYLVEEGTGMLDLVFHTELSPDFVKSVCRYEPDSPNAKLVAQGKPVYTEHFGLGVPLDERERREGLSAIAILPILHRGRVIGCLNIASHVLKEVPAHSRAALETIAAQIGGTIVRLKTEQILRESEERYRQLVSTTTDAVMLFDAETRQFVDVNKACEQLYGYSRDEFLDLRQPDISAEPAKSDASIKETLAGKLKKIPVRCHRKKDGTIFPVEISASTFELRDRRVVCGVIRDITKRKLAERELRESEQKLRTIFDNAGGAIFIADIETGEVLQCNREAEKLTGRAQSEIVGMHQSELHPPGQADEYRERFRLHVREGRFLDFEGEVQHRDGRRIPVFISAETFTVGGRDVILGLFIDITERKQAQEALHKSEQKYRSLIANIPDVVWTSDENGNTTFISANIEDIYGYTADEIYSAGDRLWFGRIHPDDREKVKESFEAVFEKGQRLDVEYRIRRKDGQWIWIQDRSIGAYEKDGVKYADGVSFDITERKKAKQALRHRLDFETLITTISTQFVSLRPDEIDKGINGALQAIGEFVDADRSYVFQHKDNASKMDNTHEWCREGIESHIHRLQDLCVDDFYMAREVLKRAEVLQVPCLADLPEEALADRREFEAEGIQSLLCVPLVCGEAWVGFLGFDSVQKEKTWSQDDITLLKVVGENIANGLERKRAETALRMSELRIRSLIEQTTDAVFCYEYDPPIDTDLAIEQQVKLMYDGVLVECNDVCAKSYGARRAQDVIGRKLTELFGTTPGGLDKLFRGLIEAGYRMVDGEGVEKFEGGTERHYLNNGHGVIEDGKLVRVWGTFRDITDRKQAEEALVREREFTEVAINSQIDTFFVFDPTTGTPKRWNRAFREISGYTDDEIASMKAPDDWYSQEDLIKAANVTESILRGERATIEMSLITKDGRKMPTEYTASAIFDEQGASKYVVAIGRDITERKKAEAALQESEERLAKAFQSNPNLMGILDLDEKQRLLLNDSFTRITGYSLEEATGTSVDELNFWIDQDKLNEAIRLVRQNNILQDYEVDIRTKQGQIRTLRYSGATLDIPEKNLFMVSAEDITERKQAEEALQESESRFRELVENIREVFWMENADGTELLYVSPAYEQVWGRSCQSFYENPQSWIEAIQPDDRKRVSDAFAQFRKTGTYSEEFRIVRPDGSIRWIWDRGVLIRDESGEILRVAGIAEDITERKQVTEKLKESENRFRALFEKAPDGIIVADVNTGNYLYVNPAICKRLGYSEEEIKAKSLQHIHPKEDQARIERLFFMQARGEIDIAEDIPFFRKDGDISYFDVNSALLEINGRKCVAGLLRDITQRKQAEQELKIKEDTISSSISGIGIANLDGKMVYVNNSLVKMWGYERKDEIIGRSLLEFWEGEGIFETVRALKAKRGRIGEDIGKRKDGSLFPVQFVASTICDGAGNPTYMSGSFIDITDRKQAEQERRRLTAILEATSDFVSTATPDGRITYINRAGRRMIGLADDEDRIERRIAEAHPDWAVRIIENEGIPAAFERGLWKGETALLGPGGVEIPTSQVIMSHKTADGEVEYLSTIIRDITERKQAEEDLRESEKKFRRIFESANDAMIYLDKLGFVLDVNKKAVEISGASREELQGKHFTQAAALSVKDIPRLMWAFKGLLQGQNPSLNVVVKTKRGVETPLECTASLIKANDKVVGAMVIARDITEREQAERALRESEARYRAIVEDQTELICRNLPDSTITFVNEAYCRCFDCSREELIGHKFTPLIPEADRAKVKEHFASLGPDRPVAAHEHRAIMPDGQIRWQQWTNRAILDNAGNTIEFQGAGRDITERKKAQEALHRSEQKYRSLIANIPDVVWTSDENGNTIFISANVEDVYGYSPEEIYSQGDKLWFGRIHPDDREKVKESFEAVFEKGQRLDVEYRIRRKDDQWIWIQDRSIGAYEKDGVKHADGVFCDVTERKQALESLRESEETAAALLNATSDAALLIDSQGGVIAVNRSMAEALGKTPEEIVGTVIYDYLPPDLARQRRARALEAAHTRGPVRFEDQRAGRWLENSVFPIFTPQGEILRYAIYSRDITERRQAEQALQESQGKLNAMLASISDQMGMIDKSFNIIWANEPTKRLFGDDIVGKKCYEVYHGRHKPCSRKQCVAVRAFKDAGAHEHEIEMTYKDGRKRYHHCTAHVALRDAKGKPLAVLEVSRDITERKHTEVALRESEARFRTLFESAPDAIYLTDMEGNFVDGNRAAEQLSGFGREELIGKSFLEAELL